MHRLRAVAPAGVALLLAGLVTGCAAAAEHTGTLISSAPDSVPPTTVLLSLSPRTVIPSLRPTPSPPPTLRINPTPASVTTVTSPPVTSAPVTPASNCDPSYPGVCLRDGIGDYDCSGGTGNGPNYVTGPIKVLPPDPFRLDSNHDGIGCNSR